MQTVLCKYGQYTLLSDTTQEESEQRPHKVSFEVLLKGPEAEQLVSDVAVQLKSHRQPVNLIYSGGADLDILPAGASKGKGLEFLLEQVPQQLMAS